MSEQQAFNYLARPGLLVLDEVGVQHGSETERMLLTEIVNDRYADEKPTILISNLTMLEFTQVVGERVADRFKEGGRVVVFVCVYVCVTNVCGIEAAQSNNSEENVM